MADGLEDATDADGAAYAADGGGVEDAAADAVVQGAVSVGDAATQHFDLDGGDEAYAYDDAGDGGRRSLRLLVMVVLLAAVGWVLAYRRSWLLALLARAGFDWERLSARLNTAAAAVQERVQQLLATATGQPVVAGPPGAGRGRSDSEALHAGSSTGVGGAPGGAPAGAAALSASASKARRLAGGRSAATGGVELQPIADHDEEEGEDDDDEEDGGDERTPLSPAAGGARPPQRSTAAAATPAAPAPAPAPPPPPPAAFVPALLGVDPDSAPLLTPAEVGALSGHLPQRCGGKDWVLLFSTDRDGYALQTLYARAQHVGPTMVVVQSERGDVVAGFASRDWSGTDVLSATGMAARVANAAAAAFSSPGKGGRGYTALPASASGAAAAAGGPTTAHSRLGGAGGTYFGTGESFLATVRQAAAGGGSGGPVVYHWTRANNYFQISRADCLGFGGSAHSSGATLHSLAGGGGGPGGGGGGGGKHTAHRGLGLWLDANLEVGYTGPCDTFGNPRPLLRCDDESGRFRVLRVEVWGFTQHIAAATAASSSHHGHGATPASKAALLRIRASPLQQPQTGVSSIAAVSDLEPRALDVDATDDDGDAGGGGGDAGGGAATIGQWGHVLSGGLSPVRAAAHVSLNDAADAGGGSRWGDRSWS